MAKRLVTGKYICTICHSEYSYESQADSCRDSHDIVYIPMTKTELNRLLHAIAFGDLSIIPDSLNATLKKYQRLHGAKD